MTESTVDQRAVLAEALAARATGGHMDTWATAGDAVARLHARGWTLARTDEAARLRQALSALSAAASSADHAQPHAMLLAVDGDLDWRPTSTWLGYVLDDGMTAAEAYARLKADLEA